MWYLVKTALGKIFRIRLREGRNLWTIRIGHLDIVALMILLQLLLYLLLYLIDSREYRRFSVIG